MGDELNDGTNITGEFRRRRPIPIPLYDDRYIERPYLKKHELAKIRDNLDELVDIKEEIADKITNKSKDKDNNITDFGIIKLDNFDKKGMNDQTKYDIDKNNKETINTQEVLNKQSEVSTHKVEAVKAETAKSETNKIEIDKVNTDKVIIDKIEINKKNKFGINNLIDNLQKNKRKVKIMNDEEVTYGRQTLESEFERFNNKKETDKAIRRAAELAEQNRKELDEIKKSLAFENAEIKKNIALENVELRNDIKKEFGNKFNELSGKFENVNGKFEGVSKKLEDTCTGIDCLKRNFSDLTKNMDLMECPDCHEKVVPPRASYCPHCSAKMTWYEDDGVTPLKGWNPSWKN